VEPAWTVTSSDDVTLAGYELGGDGDVMLISHATGLCALMYRRLADLLTEHFRVVTFDYRGHGRSTTPATTDALAWQRIAHDTAAVRARLGDGPVHAFGHSMGGACLLLAERAQPGSFASLFLFEPIVFPEGHVDGQNTLAEGARRRRAEFPSRADVLARYATKPPYDGILAGCLADYVEHGFADVDDGVRLRCDPVVESTVFANGSGSTVAGLDAVAVPTVVAAGRPPGAAELSPFVAAALPQAQFTDYPQLDHFGPFQDPFTLAAAITAHARA